MEDLISTKSRTALQKMFMRLKQVARETSVTETLNILKPLVTPDVAGIAPTALPAAGGDLSGTLDDAVVDAIQGVVITGTPAVGSVLIATSPTAAHWAASSSISLSKLITNGDSHFPELVFDSNGDVMWGE